MRKLPILIELDFLQLLWTSATSSAMQHVGVAMWVVLGPIQQNRHQSFATIDNKETKAWLSSWKFFLEEFSGLHWFWWCPEMNFGLFWVVEFALASSNQYLGVPDPSRVWLAWVRATDDQNQPDTCGVTLLYDWFGLFCQFFSNQNNKTFRGSEVLGVEWWFNYPKCLFPYIEQEYGL